MKSLIGTELKRFLRKYKRHNKPEINLTILLQSVAYPYNVGSIFRLADGACINELILSGITPKPPNPTIAKVGRLKSQNVPWRYEEDPLKVVQELRDKGCHVIALELTDVSIPYHQYSYPKNCCLVAGHEDHGVTKAVLASCDRIAQRCGQMIKDGCVEQKSLDGRRLLVENLLYEIIQDEAVASTKGLDDRCPLRGALGVYLASYGESRHLQTCNPALSTIVQAGDLI